MPKLEPRFAILASGRGSNAVALMEAFRTRFIPATLALVVANKAGAPVLERARERGVPAQLVAHQGLSRAAHEDALLAALQGARVEHLLLAGYMRVLGAHFLARFS